MTVEIIPPLSRENLDHFCLDLNSIFSMGGDGGGILRMMVVVIHGNTFSGVLPLPCR
jgi:hypothetical protein